MAESEDFSQPGSSSQPILYSLSDKPR